MENNKKNESNPPYQKPSLDEPKKVTDPSQPIPIESNVNMKEDIDQRRNGNGSLEKGQSHQPKEKMESQEQDTEQRNEERSSSSQDPEQNEKAGYGQFNDKKS
jgi:hypothetical protein